MSKKLKVLVACEESQRVCSEFRKLGHEAYSADIQECSGGHPEWHVLGDVLRILNGGKSFKTMDGKKHYVRKWDLIIAHPPCTYLCIGGVRWYNVERYGQAALDRMKKREEALEFFKKFLVADCEHIAVENPPGFISSMFRKADFYVQPYYFCDSAEDKENYESKRTGFWTKNLPPLRRISFVEWAPGDKMKYFAQRLSRISDPAERSRMRSKTFPGIAKAIATQWSEFLENKDE